MPLEMDLSCLVKQTTHVPPTQCWAKTFKKADDRRRLKGFNLICTISRRSYLQDEQSWAMIQLPVVQKSSLLPDFRCFLCNIIIQLERWLAPPSVEEDILQHVNWDWVRFLTKHSIHHPWKAAKTWSHLGSVSFSLFFCHLRCIKSSLIDILWRYKLMMGLKVKMSRRLANKSVYTRSIS